MYVRDLMKRAPVTLLASDHLDLADGIMRLGHIRHLPVVDGDRLVGLVSHRDLLRATAASLLRLHADGLQSVPVHSVMTPKVFSVAPTVSLRAAVALMLEKRIGCLPVVDDGKLVGLLSETDCLAHLKRLLEREERRAGLPTVAPD
jgi:CBS domain-containing protein